ncbi:DUF3140 domain-containing protein [Streptosporangium sp. 'caverna']|uniref:DUF3140 domain-containing protein n=1 Tax=Streptosporangium sp. 'caverna' TaxID=2202249 RepID=UPI000D7D6E3C|nr:DUF3140 domain-containing protein [Streptosporangium sp. 'caverna']AWS41323.1 DNA-binding protein [Streptosporangium sp. 'caverna']
MTDDREQTAKDFHQAVNMTATELDRWLGTRESKAVGAKSGGAESIGHESGRRIAKILKKGNSDLSEDDYAHMRTVTGYIRRHLAQRPSGDVQATPWRHSLMNWGHDPLK